MIGGRISKHAIVAERAVRSAAGEDRPVSRWPLAAACLSILLVAGSTDIAQAQRMMAKGGAMRGASMGYPQPGNYTPPGNMGSHEGNGRRFGIGLGPSLLQHCGQPTCWDSGERGSGEQEFGCREA